MIKKRFFALLDRYLDNVNQSVSISATSVIYFPTPKTCLSELLLTTTKTDQDFKIPIKFTIWFDKVKTPKGGPHADRCVSFQERYSKWLQEWVDDNTQEPN